MNKRLQEIEARKSEIRALLEGEEEVNLDEMEKELRALEQEKEGIEKRAKIAADIQVGKIEARQIEKPEKEERKPEPTKLEIRERRGKDLMEKRAVTVASSDIVLPKYNSNDIKPTFNEVSSLIDRVHLMPLMGGESFSQSYLKGFGTGDYSTENTVYNTAEPTFDYVDIAKSKITAYAEDSEETLKLPAADYDSIVVNGITVAVRKKITQQILTGAGTTNTFTGIFSANASAIDASTDIEFETIDDETLDEILYSFGGDEDVEDTSVLILNKIDLKAFATLRNSDGRKTYTVVNNGNTGTIDGVPYIINSACKAISDSANADGDYAMAYGPLSNYTMALFSPLDVQRSNDYQFKNGMIAHRGSIFAGGNVTSHNGFLRVTKQVVA